MKNQTNEVMKFTTKRMALSDRIVMIEEVKNGHIQLDLLDKGHIVSLQNQIEATALFYMSSTKHHEMKKALQVQSNYGTNGKLRGFAVELNRKSFAIHYEGNDTFDNISVEVKEAESIPFFSDIQVPSYPSRWSLRNEEGEMENMRCIRLYDLKEALEDAFGDWVKNHTTSREITEEEKEDGEFPDGWDFCLTDTSLNDYYKEKHKLELAFAKATGIYVAFEGGIMSE